MTARQRADWPAGGRRKCGRAQPTQPAAACRWGHGALPSPSGASTPGLTPPAAASASALRWNPLAAQGPKAIWGSRVPRDYPRD